jgi:hypothetical protein
MASKDFKSLLLQYSSALFDLHTALEALKFNPTHHPTIRYDRGQKSAFELFWSDENPPAALNITWLSYSNSPMLRSNGTSTLPIPPTVKAKALALLQELDTKRELVALYRCGYIKDNKFTLSSWPIPFPVDYEPDNGEDGCLYYTITLGGTLGVAGCYAANYAKLCTALL